MVIIDLCAVILTIYTLLLPRTLILKLTKKSFRVLDTYLLIFTTFVLDSMQCLPKARSASFFSWSKNIIAGTRWIPPISSLRISWSSFFCPLLSRPRALHSSLNSSKRRSLNGFKPAFLLFFPAGPCRTFFSRSARVRWGLQKETARSWHIQHFHLSVHQPQIVAGGHHHEKNALCQ